ncbi:hypothetical protein MMC27_007438 [Xylographa pallens]|nr:hypothetical protein [Xylographa pallens]
MSNTVNHIYQPLKHDQSIRLVTISPGVRCPLGRSNPLHCELEQSRLDQHPQYEALSYVWGDPTVKDPIHLGRIQLSITRNLHAALLHLRSEQKGRKLWIDAICINQCDVTEKNMQVSLMGDIYRAASGVIVWLGEKSHSDKRSTILALEYLRKLSSGPLVELRERLTDGSPEDRDSASASLFHTLRTELQIFSSPFSKDAQVWKILRNFLCRDWFQRSWILQEVALSMHSTRIQSNTFCIEFESMYQALLSIEVFGLTSSLAPFANEDSLIRYMGCAQNHARKDPNHYQLKLSYLLSARRPCLATDPRDKVFALVGIANDAQELLPDYSKSLTDVYLQTAEHIFSTDGNITLLSEVKGLQLGSGLPSWVPDWRVSPSVILLATKNTDGTKRYAASGICHPKFAVDTPGSGMLVVHGLCFDKVSQHLGKVSKISEGKEYIPWMGLRDYGIGLWAEMARSVYPDGVYSPTGEPLIQVYDRVLTGDQSLTSERLDKAGKSAFYPETLNHISTSRSDISYTLHPQAIKQVKDLGIDLEAAIWSYLKGPELYTTVDIMKYLYKSSRIDGVSPEIEAQVESEQHSVRDAITGGRRLFISEAGHMGLCPESTEPADVICIIFGADVPFVLRPLQNGHFLLVGECYVDGFMDGQAILQVARDAKCRRVDFTAGIVPEENGISIEPLAQEPVNDATLETRNTVERTSGSASGSHAKSGRVIVTEEKDGCFRVSCSGGRQNYHLSSSSFLIE